MVKAKRAAKTINAKRASRPKSGSRATSAKTSAVIKTPPASKAKRAAKTTNVLSRSTSATAMVAVIGTPPAPKISWDDYVAEGKRLVAESKRLVAEAEQMIATADQYGWQLAELADQVVAIYKEHKLAKFASEIGVSHCAIKRRRSTFRNWKETLKGDPGLLLRLSYSVARALEKHPDREKLIKENPGMSRRQATALIKAFRAETESEMEHWWKDMNLRMGKAAKDETRLDEDRQILLAVVKQPMLSSLREAGQAWIRLADGLDKLFNESANEEFDSAA